MLRLAFIDYAAFGTLLFLFDSLDFIFDLFKLDLPAEDYDMLRSALYEA